MTTTTLPPAPRTDDLADSLRTRTLPVVAVRAIHAISVVLVVAGLFGFGGFRVAVLGFALAFVVPIWSRAVEGGRKAIDRLVTLLVTSAFGLALIPLGSIMWTVLEQGVPVLSAEFFSYSMRNVVGEGGGIYHAMVGTLLITAAATAISVPIGLFTAIYLIEYGEDGRMSTWIRFLVDVMTGIPSIVAGLFAYALFVVFFGDGVRMGIGGAVALAGIVTGITLAIARVIGETAPLLVIAGATDSVNFNLFDGRMATLPVFTYSSIMQPGVPPEPSIERAWGAALVLLAIVMVLNLVARLVSHFFSPKGER